MVKPRWMIELDIKNNDHEYLRLVTLYAENENKELVKAENAEWSYTKEIIIAKSLRI